MRIFDEPKHNTFGLKKLGCSVAKTSRERNNPLTDLIFSLLQEIEYIECGCTPREIKLLAV